MSGLKPGDGVTAYFYLNCGHCRRCLSMLEPLCDNYVGNVGLECDGGYAEYIKLPAHIFIKYPDGLDYKKHPAEMGVITDALATPYKVLRRAAIKGGETVAVIGAGGGIGIHQLMMAKWANARVIAVDTAADKFDACRKAGADEVVNPQDGDVVEALRDLTHGDGVDVVIDYVSTTATQEAGVKALGQRGRLVILGGAAQPFPAPARDMLTKEQAILGSRYVTRAEILEACDLVARGEVWPLVTVCGPCRRPRPCTIWSSAARSPGGRRCRLRRALYFLRMRKVSTPSVFRLAFQRVAGLPQQIGNIDRGQRIGAFGHDQVAAFQGGQHLAHPQRRQRAFQAAQIHGFFVHKRSKSLVIPPRWGRLNMLIATRSSTGKWPRRPTQYRRLRG